MTLKSNVRNRAYPEGYIVEWYIANETITHCSRYFEGTEIKFTKPSRNDDDVIVAPTEDASLHFLLGRHVGLVFNAVLDDKALIQAHLYVLFNSDVITPFIEYELSFSIFIIELCANNK